MMFYVLSVALILTGCLVFYKLLLQKETFFSLNRFVLLICLALSFVIPLIPVPQQWSFREISIEEFTTADKLTKGIVTPITAHEQVAFSVHPDNTKDIQKNRYFKDISIPLVLLYGYWFGVIIFSLNFIFQLVVLLYRAYQIPAVRDGRFRIIELNGEHSPCSFGNNIFINPEKYDWDTYDQIILHEKIHIRQGHSVDILLAELALIFQWFNPFAWLYRKAIENNLEFLTDNELLAHSGMEAASYQMSLVKVSAPHFHSSLTANYNQSALKKRVLMMSAKRSSINSTWKCVFIVPLLLVFTALMNEPVANGKSSLQGKQNEKFQPLDNGDIWIASVRGDKVYARFESLRDKRTSNQIFSLKEFKNLTGGTEGTFSVTRDAGTMNLTGKFENNVGRGKYKFNNDQSFNNFLSEQGVTERKESDGIVFFLINLKKEYIKSLRTLGYNQIPRNELISLAVLNVSPDYIKSLNSAGLEGIPLKKLIALKALAIDPKFITTVKESGYPKIAIDKKTAIVTALLKDAPK